MTATSSLARSDGSSTGAGDNDDALKSRIARLRQRSDCGVRGDSSAAADAVPLPSVKVPVEEVPDAEPEPAAAPEPAACEHLL